MICPQCGYDMGNRNKCIRCGYEVKTLVTVDETQESKEEKIETKIIDPCNVYITHPYGYENDYDTSYGPSDDPFASILDELFGDPIGDLLGGLFGFDFGPRRHATVEPKEPPRKKKQGPIVVVDDVEIIPPDAPEPEPKTEDKEAPKDGGKKEHKIKNMFKKKNRK